MSCRERWGMVTVVGEEATPGVVPAVPGRAFGRAPYAGQRREQCIRRWFECDRVEGDLYRQRWWWWCNAVLLCDEW